MFDGGKVTEYRQGDIVFFIRPMNPFQSLRLLGDLQKLITPVAGKMVSSLGGDKKSGDIIDRSIDADIIAQAFAALAETVDGQKLEQMCGKILDGEYVGVSICGDDPEKLTPARTTELFSGNLSDMVLLIMEVLKVNYGDFTRLFKSLFGRAEVLKRAK